MAPDERADDDANAAVPESPSMPARPGRLAVLSAYVSLVFVVGFILDAALLRADPAGFIRVHRWLGGLPARLVLALVAFALLFHGLDGLRRTLLDVVPTRDRFARGLESAVVFLTLAIGLPLSLAVIWPAIYRWFA